MPPQEEEKSPEQLLAQRVSVLLHETRTAKDWTRPVTELREACCRFSDYAGMICPLLCGSLKESDPNDPYGHAQLRVWRFISYLGGTALEVFVPHIVTACLQHMPRNGDAVALLELWRNSWTHCALSDGDLERVHHWLHTGRLLSPQQGWALVHDMYDRAETRLAQGFTRGEWPHDLPLFSGGNVSVCSPVDTSTTAWQARESMLTADQQAHLQQAQPEQPEPQPEPGTEGQSSSAAACASPEQPAALAAPGAVTPAAEGAAGFVKPLGAASDAAPAPATAGPCAGRFNASAGAAAAGAAATGAGARRGQAPPLATTNGAAAPAAAKRVVPITPLGPAPAAAGAAGGRFGADRGAAAPGAEICRIEALREPAAAQATEPAAAAACPSTPPKTVSFEKPLRSSLRKTPTSPTSPIAPTAGFSPAGGLPPPGPAKAAQPAHAEPPRGSERRSGPPGAAAAAGAAPAARAAAAARTGAGASAAAAAPAGGPAAAAPAAAAPGPADARRERRRAAAAQRAAAAGVPPKNTAPAPTPAASAVRNTTAAPAASAAKNTAAAPAASAAASARVHRKPGTPAAAPAAAVREIGRKRGAGPDPRAPGAKRLRAASFTNTAADPIDLDD
eukprot:TRINITY_DN19727_c0_g1_i2.p1 TRINITY_DN19727_c0_g1~~TRINITY_DN19727_c0_g1_i2.p1  ORF type:complete len:619 (+),score=82.16 TRINITY_DN19727_c0_g1_i2:98-1954(+)